jgi:pyruvate formate-lyase/glycerol dehydratase family glycyl radical enzyme
MVMEREIDRDLLRRIDELQLSERLSRWKDAALSAKPKICVERAKLAMESWKETEGEDIEIRRAKLLKKILEDVPIAIHEFDLVVGRETEHLFGANPHIDLSGDYIGGLHEETDITVGGPVVKGVLSQQERDVLIECSRFFADRAAVSHIEKAWRTVVGTWHDDLFEARGQEPSLRIAIVPGKNNRPNWEKLFTKGLRGIIEEAEVNIQHFIEMGDDDIDRFNFWQAVVTVCQAVINYARRYAELAHQMAKREEDTERRSELEEIAKVCEWIPENPVRTLHEAVQFVVFIRTACKLEHTGDTTAVGRLDQFLWPYFERDVKNGNITLERAADLVGGLIAFLGTQTRVEDVRQYEMAQASSQVNQITVGGVNRDGEDAANELSYLILHMVGILGLPEPHVTFRWHPSIPRFYLLKAIDTNLKVKGATPQFESDQHAIEWWVEHGASLEEARDWYGLGCSIVNIPSKLDYTGGSGVGSVNLALILDLALHNGMAPVTGKRIGLETGDPHTFKTFEDLLEVFKKQHRFVFKRVIWLGSLAHRIEQQYIRLPFISSVAFGCTEKGRDCVCMDPEELVFCVQDRAIIDTVDSLIAIKKLVFDNKKLTMPELLEALDSNFEGEGGEDIRQMCLAAPKFGNDIDEVDWMVRDIGSFSAGVIRSEENSYGILGTLGVQRSGLAWHILGGRGVGALPNGRKAGQPLYDGSFSPMHGADKHGPTITLRSVLKAGFQESQMTVLNQKFSNKLMQSPESREKLVMLTDAFFRGGGQHIQYNLVDAQMLRDAKEHPEMHRDLIVRVGGFSAYFVHLSPEVQDDIIARTEQSFY